MLSKIEGRQLLAAAHSVLLEEAGIVWLESLAWALRHNPEIDQAQESWGGMPRCHIPRSDRARYYLGAANFWFEVVHLQKARSQQQEKSGVESRADLNFSVVAVQRLHEVARMIRDRLRIREIGQAIDEFDARWPKFKELRNLEEHILGPSLDSPIWRLQFRLEMTRVEAEELRMWGHRELVRAIRESTG